MLNNALKWRWSSSVKMQQLIKPNYETQERPRISHFIKLKKQRPEIKPEQKIKALIFDSGTLINLSINGLLYILEEIKNSTEIKMLITNEVKYELIDRPLNVPRFELSALKIQRLIDLEVLEFPESLNISKEILNSTTQKLMSIANSIVKADGKFIKIVSNAEMSCLALSSLLTEKEIENIIGIDERTTRILAEKPANLQKIMENKLHTKIQLVNKLDSFEKFRFIRSTELVYAAYKKGFLKLTGAKALEAVLYATKYAGSSVSWDEINVLKKM